MNEFVRPLAGYRMNLSVSESEDSIPEGYPNWQVNRITLQLTSALFGQGVTILFGHNWRDDGVMQAVHGFAQQVQPPLPVIGDESKAQPQPLLLNLIPWPDSPYLSAEELEMLAPTLSVIQTGVPHELESVRDKALASGRNSRIYMYVRARGLTVLRKRLTEFAQARLCIGGRRSGSEGRYPGVLEEALFALANKTPLYLSGILGGIARDLIEVIEGQNLSGPSATLNGHHDLFTNPPIVETDGTTKADRQVDIAHVLKLFRDLGPNGVALQNGLTVAENQEMFHTEVVDRVIQLTLTGLARLRAKAEG